jgi:DNA-binding transcriptional ArsR family regulator
MKEITIRRRNRLRHHYTIVSNVILLGYHQLSDAAKVTYLAIDSFDWGDGTGERKGYAYPSLGRLARDRGVDRRTIRRHLAELEEARLITREERPGKPSVLIIEDPSQEETSKYLRTFENQGEDKKVLPTPDKIVRPYKEDKEQERQNLVNDEQALSEKERGVGRLPERIGVTIKERYSRMRPRGSPLPQDKARRKYLVREMLAVLKDRHSLGYYREVAAEVAPARIFEALSEVKRLARDGAIRKSKGAMFTALTAPIVKALTSSLSPANASSTDPTQSA